MLKRCMAGLAVAVVCAGCSPKPAEAPKAAQPAADAAPTAPAPVTDADMAEFDKRFGSQKMWPVLKARFPEEYKQTVGAIIGLAKAGASLEQINEDTIKATQDIRTKYATQGAQAPDAQLIKLLSNSLSMHMHVREAKGPAVCDAYAAEGLAALLPDTDTFQPDVEEGAVVVFETLAEGRDHPTPAAPPTDADLKLVLADVVKHGISEGMIAQLADAKHPPPEGARCLYDMQFLKSVIATAGEPGHRVRADIAKSILAGEPFK